MCFYLIISDFSRIFMSSSRNFQDCLSNFANGIYHGTSTPITFVNLNDHFEGNLWIYPLKPKAFFELLGVCSKLNKIPSFD